MPLSLSSKVLSDVSFCELPLVLLADVGTFAYCTFFCNDGNDRCGFDLSSFFNSVTLLKYLSAFG